MKFSSEIAKGVLTLDMSGDLIGEDSGALIIECVTDAINADVKSCIIDISDLRYINSSGIGVLITCLTKFRNKEGELVLLKPSESVKKLLIITKLNAIFTIAENKEEALKIIK